MSAIEDFKKKKAELIAVRQLTTIAVSQVEYPAGGAVAQFIFDGMTPGQVASIVRYMLTKQTQILGAIKDDLRAECEALRLQASAEAAQFVTDNNVPVV